MSLETLVCDGLGTYVGSDVFDDCFDGGLEVVSQSTLDRDRANQESTQDDDSFVEQEGAHDCPKQMLDHPES